MNTAPLLDVQGLSVGMARPSGSSAGSMAGSAPSPVTGPLHSGLAVKDLSFVVQRGETLCLVGESGCGKSIAALAVMRLLPEGVARVLGGSIHFAGQNLLTLPDAAMRAIRGNSIGMVFQDPAASLNPVMRIGRQIAEGICLHQGLSAREAERLAIDMLEKVRIPSPAQRAREYPHQMSGGMRQRVMIAMALACSPALLIADEPTTALDVTVQKQILELIHSLVADAGSGLLLISHDLGVVAQTCDKVAVMYAGEIVEKGRIEDIFSGDVHHPYTKGLFNSIPDLEVMARRLTPIDGLMPDPTDLPAGCKFHPRCTQCMDICRTEGPTVYTSGQHQIACHLYGTAGGENHG